MGPSSTSNDASAKIKQDIKILHEEIEALNRELVRHRQAEEVLRIIAAGTAAVTGGDFFRPLVQHLAAALQVRCAFVTECTDVTMTRVRTLAYIENNRFEEDIEYDLIGTPCELAIGGSVVYYPDKLEKLFPKEAGLESYLGVPIHDIAGQKILGHLAVLDDRPMHREPYETSILQIFAARAGAELERKRALEALQQAHDELEQRVEVRTAELKRANQQLEQEIMQRRRAQTEQAQLIAELDAFAHTVAHDLKNPLSIVAAQAEVLEEDWPTSEERQNAVQAITRGAHKMDTIIRELLLLAQTRNKDVALQPLDKASIVSHALQRLDLLIAAQQTTIILPDQWPTALGHAPWVEEIWENYLSNAIKYGGKPPCVELGATIQADGMLCFWVQDNGAGLTQPAQADLFVPFAQHGQGDRGGHGLGLSIVQRVVERLGGRVGVCSEGVSGKGSQFWFTLPAA
jgi:signal transduction histidine kinase